MHILPHLTYSTGKELPYINRRSLITFRHVCVLPHFKHKCAHVLLQVVPPQHFLFMPSMPAAGPQKLFSYPVFEFQKQVFLGGSFCKGCGMERCEGTKWICAHVFAVTSEANKRGPLQWVRWNYHSGRFAAMVGDACREDDGQS